MFLTMALNTNLTKGVVMEEQKTYNFITKRISEGFKKAGVDWRKDMPYGDRPFDIKGLKTVDIDDMIEFGIDSIYPAEEEPPHTIVLLKGGGVLIINTRYSCPANYYVLGTDGWVYANDLTKTQLKKFIR
jgi:hypothetical protein